MYDNQWLQKASELGRMIWPNLVSSEYEDSDIS